MCLEVPGRIVSITGENPLRMAVVDFSGVKRNVCISTVDAEIGDYVIVHAGMAISVIDTQQALETIKDLEKMADYRENLDM